MVVIIDDRADVWEWSPNLVKVIPCKWIACVLESILVIYEPFFYQMIFSLV